MESEKKELLPGEKVLINELAKKEGFENYQIHISNASDAGDNYMSFVYRLIIKDDSKKSLRLILKRAIPSNSYRNAVPLNKMFQREVYLYEKVFPFFVQFQKLKNIDFSNGFFHYPKYYGSNLTENEEYLVLEDLSTFNFLLKPKNKCLDLEHSKFVLKYLARYHALSFAVRDQNPEIFDEFAKNCPEIILDYLDFNKEYLENCNKAGKEMLNTLDPNVDKLAYEKFEIFAKNMFNILIELSEVRKHDKFTVLSQGDCWHNNIFFKYDDSNPNKPIDIRIIDYQVSHLTSPILDVSYFVYNCTDPEKFQENVQLFIEYYYKNFCSFIEQLGSNPEKVFPRSEFERSVKQYFKHGVQAASYLTGIMLKEKEGVDARTFEGKAQNDFLSVLNFEKKAFNHKVRLIIKNAAERGFI